VVSGALQRNNRALLTTAHTSSSDSQSLDKDPEGGSRAERPSNRTEVRFIFGGNLKEIGDSGTSV
jgi:hypothetical protein